MRSLGNVAFPSVGLIAVLVIFIVKWFKGDELIPEDSLSILSILWLLFFASNLLAYFAAISVSTFLSIVRRLGSIFEMDEFTSERQSKVNPEDTMIKIKDASFSWGFKVRHDQAKGNNQGRIKVEKPVLTGISFEMRKGDHLVIVG